MSAPPPQGASIGDRAKSAPAAGRFSPTVRASLAKIEFDASMIVNRSTSIAVSPSARKTDDPTNNRTNNKTAPTTGDSTSFVFSRKIFSREWYAEQLSGLSPPGRGDFVGGVTLGLVLMSQSVAHARLCNLSGADLIHGPYSCMLPPIVYALLGTSRHGNVGTGSLVALLVGEFVTQAAIPTTQASVLEQVLCMSFITGFVLLAMRACGLQALVKFLSRAALSGFMNASAVLIIESQVRDIIGLRHPDPKPKGFVHKCFVLCDQMLNLDFVNPYIGILGVTQLTILVGLKKVKQSAWLKDLAKEGDEGTTTCRSCLHRTERACRKIGYLKNLRSKESKRFLRSEGVNHSWAPPQVTLRETKNLSSMPWEIIMELRLFAAPSSSSSPATNEPGNSLAGNTGASSSAAQQSQASKRSSRLFVAGISLLAKMKDIFVVIFGAESCYVLTTEYGLFLANVGHLPRGLPSLVFPPPLLVRGTLYLGASLYLRKFFKLQAHELFAKIETLEQEKAQWEKKYLAPGSGVLPLLLDFLLDSVPRQPEKSKSGIMEHYEDTVFLCHSRRVDTW